MTAALTDLVWMQTTRHAEYHKPRTQNTVVCGADLRRRIQMTRVMAADAFNAKPCGDCWPGGGP